jgi:hypothetical protein
MNLLPTNVETAVPTYQCCITKMTIQVTFPLVKSVVNRIIILITILSNETNLSLKRYQLSFVQCLECVDYFLYSVVPIHNAVLKHRSKFTFYTSTYQVISAEHFL